MTTSALTAARSTNPAVIAALFVLLIGGALAGCNTAEGFGEDLSSAGEEIEEEAE